jgi:hypothetical protein
MLVGQHKEDEDSNGLLVLENRKSMNECYEIRNHYRQSQIYAYLCNQNNKITFVLTLSNADFLISSMIIQYVY